MKKTILIAAISAMSLGAYAGDWGKVPVGKAPIEECYDIGAVLSTGYMTDYIHRGVRHARDSVWVDVNYTFDNLAVPVTIGVSYLNGINGDWNNGTLPIFFPTFDRVPIPFDEVNLYAIFGLGTFLGFDVDLEWRYRDYPELRSAAGFGTPRHHELGLTLRRDLGFADFVTNHVAAFGFGNAFGGGMYNGWYHQAGFERGYQLTDNVGLVWEAGVAYADGYWGNLSNVGGARSSGWNHYYLTLSLPIELNCRAVLTPYIGYNGVPNTWLARDGSEFQKAEAERHNDILHGGVTLSVSF